MTKVLARVSEPQNDPIVSIVDLDETKGMVPIGALNGRVMVEMVFLSNEQARLIRKAMDNGARGEELDAAIVTILAPEPPAEEVNNTGSVPANQDPMPAGLQNDHALDAANAIPPTDPLAPAPELPPVGETPPASVGDGNT